MNEMHVLDHTVEKIAPGLRAVVGHVHVVEALTHGQALAKAQDEAVPFFYRHNQTLYRCHRLGTQYIIINHATNGYLVSDLVKKGMIEMVPNKSFEALGKIIKRRLPLRGWLENCLLHARAPQSAERYMSSLYKELSYSGY